MAEKFAIASELNTGYLPTKKELFSHYLYIRETNIKSGEWNQYTPLSEVAKCVAKDVAALWDKTGIPHKLSDSNEGVRMIMSVINKCKDMNKIPLERRKPGFGQDLDILYDVAKCPHPNESSCDCTSENQVLHLIN